MLSLKTYQFGGTGLMILILETVNYMGQSGLPEGSLKKSKKLYLSILT